MTRKNKNRVSEFITDEEREAFKSVAADKTLTVQERVDKLNRLMANYLGKRGRLPDHLKKLMDN